MNPGSIKTVGIAANQTKPASRQRVEELWALLQRTGLEILFEPDAAALVNQPAVASIAALGARSDLVIVLGGDGTILRVVRELGRCPTPLVGINIGSLGFLTAIRCEEMTESVAAILRGDVGVVRTHIEWLSSHQPKLLDAYRALGRLTLDVARRKGAIDADQAARLDAILA